MTGTVYADILRDAYMLSGGAREFAWVRTWKTMRGVPLGTAAEEAAAAAEQTGLLSLWLGACAQALRGRYTICAPEYARAMAAASGALAAAGATRFPAAVRRALDARTFDAWSASVHADFLSAPGRARSDERIFLPWVGAMYARYTRQTQE